MTTKTHLTSQEEGIKETGIQVRSDDPSSPVDDQTWLNTSQNKMKVFKDGQTRVILVGSQAAKILTVPTLECESFETFFYEANSNTNFTLQNLTDGKVVNLFVKNIDTSPILASFNLDTIPDISNPTLEVGVGKTVQFTLIRNGEVYVSSSTFDS